MSKRLPAWQRSELTTYFDIQCRRRELKDHRRRLKRMKSEVDNSCPKKLPHLSNAASQQTFSDFEYRRIDMENSKLFDRLKDLSQQPSRYPTYKSKCPKNVGEMLRNKEHEKINKENEILYRRLRSTDPVYSKEKWDSHHKNHIKIMNERMKRHAIRLHGPKFAKKLDERKYCGKYRSYSDLGSEMSFQTMSDFSTTEECSTARTQSSVCTNSTDTSQLTNNSCSSSVSSRRSKRSSRRSSRHDSRPTSSRRHNSRPSSRSKKRSNSVKNIKRKTKKDEETKIRKPNQAEIDEQDELIKACFSLEKLDQAINPDIPAIQMSMEVPKDDVEEVSDWEEDQEWEEQELTSTKPGRKNHKMISLSGIEI